MMNKNSTVFVVDDDQAIRKSLKSLLKTIDQPVQLFKNAREFLANYKNDSPGCLVVDVRMPGMSGIELQKQLLGDKISIPIIFITGHGDVDMAVNAMHYGAIDFIEKPFKIQRLIDSIQQALAEDVKNREDEVERNAIEKRFSNLTVREHEIVNFVVSGLTNKAIANQLGISSQTIDVTRTRAMNKLNTKSIPALALLVSKFNSV